MLKKTLKKTLETQVTNNAVAIVSLALAVFGIIYGVHRDDQNEQNNNARFAAFEILKNLGELQLVVDYAHYENDDMRGNPITGWARVLMVRDMAQLLPGKAPQYAQRLFKVWEENWKNIQSSENATAQISEEIKKTREAIMDTVKEMLH